MIRLTCQKCQKRLQVPDQLAGRVGKCPACGHRQQVPQPSSSEEESSAIEKNRTSQKPGESSSTTQTTSEGSPTIRSSGSEAAGTDTTTNTTASPSVTSTSVASSAAASSAQQEEREFGQSPAESEVPTSLEKTNHYLVCDRQRTIARWQNDGKGWLVNQKTGYRRAVEVASELPTFGSFVLIELGLQRGDDGIKVTGVRAFRLQRDYALRKLTQGSDQILRTIVGPTTLSASAREHLYELVRERFLPEVWSAVREVLD